MNIPDFLERVGPCNRTKSRMQQSTAARNAAYTTPSLCVEISSLSTSPRNKQGHTERGMHTRSIKIENQRLFALPSSPCPMREKALERVNLHLPAPIPWTLDRTTPVPPRRADWRTRLLSRSKSRNHEPAPRREGSRKFRGESLNLEWQRKHLFERGTGVAVSCIVLNSVVRYGQTCTGIGSSSRGQGRLTTASRATGPRACSHASAYSSSQFNAEGDAQMRLGDSDTRYRIPGIKMLWACRALSSGDRVRTEVGRTRRRTGKGAAATRRGG